MIKNKLKLCFLVAFLLGNGFSYVHAQETNLIEVSGLVTDGEGVPLPGVNVVEEGTQNGVVTNFDGAYSISVPIDGVLVFSFVGFKNQEVPVNNRNTINVSLEEDAAQLEEVVVVGYGTVKEEDLTGAVSSIGAEDLNPGATTSVQQALEGRVAGVQVYQKSGAPGSAMAVNIRGASSITAGNDPLYVVDGVPVNNAGVASGGGAGFVGNQNGRNPLNFLNPKDIESIAILKDASATAIYGARGSNGVVLITTKSGGAGRMSVTYNTYVGFQTVANKLDLLSPIEYQSVLNAIIDTGGGSEGERVVSIEGGGTNWQNLLYRDALSQNHNLAVSGGSEKISYYVSLNHLDQKGVVKSSGFKRYGARINLDITEDKEYAFGINLSTSYIYNDYVSNGVGLNENAGAIYSAINYDPTILPFDENGNYQQSQFVGPQIDNPLALLHGEDAFSKNFRTNGNVYGEYFILPSLSVKVLLGADVEHGRRDVFIEPFTNEGSANGGIASIITQRRDYYLAEGTLNFDEDFGDDNLSAVFGATYEYFGSTGFRGNARGYTLPDLRTDGIGTGDPLLNNIGSGSQSAVFISFLGRMNYSLNDKYLFTASMRADGSSRFGPNNLWGYFPSGAVAWKLHNEAFLEDVDFISELKLRASYGSIGNANIANYLYLSTFDTGGDAVFGDSQYTTINPGNTAPNPDLKWESANQLDIGIDFGFWNSRLTGTIDYYNRKTKDLLLREPLPPNTGFTGIVRNIGSMRNSGFEFALNGWIIQNQNFSWNTNFNISTLENEVLDIGSADRIIVGGLGFTGDAAIIKPGEPLNSFFGYVIEGIWQEGDDFSTIGENVSPGDFKYRDINEDGNISSDDRTIIGKPFPDFTWGLTNTFRYRDFSLSAFLKGVEGVSTLNNNLIDTYFPINFRRNKLAEPYLNRWTPENPTNEYPSFVTPLSQGQKVVNTRTVEDASYIRLQSVRLSYDVPIDGLNLFSNLTVYATGKNLLTITDYSGVDPAANAAGSDVLRIDYNAYPFSKTYLLGLNVAF